MVPNTAGERESAEQAYADRLSLKDPMVGWAATVRCTCTKPAGLLELERPGTSP